MIRTPQWAFCSQPCQTDADCGPKSLVDVSFACGILPDGSRACVPACMGGNFACVNGVPTACELVDQNQYCGACGCPDGLNCLRGLGCRPPSGLDGPCDVDLECTTNNCSTFAHVCRTPVGSPCTPENCDHCFSASNGWSYCSRECGGDDECNGGHCAAPSGGNVYTCQAPCAGPGDPTCPYRCTGVAGASFDICDCTRGCEATTAVRDIGQICWDPSQCRSGDCFRIPACAQNSSCNGICSATCSASAACGAGAACVQIPCAFGETTTCGWKCLPTCDASASDSCYGFPATCTPTFTFEGTSISACDPKRPTGGACADNTDCQSGRCTLASCASTSTSKIANGGPCGLSSECQSGNCVNAQCKGSALIGDACTQSLDCAVGMCCPSGAAGTCQTSC